MDLGWKNVDKTVDKAVDNVVDKRRFDNPTNVV